MILVDLNVIVDIILQRQPHLASSESLVNRVLQGRLPAAMAAHSVTTLHYIVHRKSGRAAAAEAVEWALRYFEIAPVGARELERARSFDWPDFEDAVVAAAAESAGCKAIITRDARGFRHSPVRAIPPEELVIDEVHESFVAGSPTVD